MLPARASGGGIRRAGFLALMLPLMGVCGPAPDAERGAMLLARYQCGSCHTIPGVAAARSKLAASLQSFGRRSYIAGRVPNDAATLARWIADPNAVIPGTPMPDMGVTPHDARDMAAYLESLQ